MRSVGISIGIAMGTGTSSFDDLLSAADTAMYLAKQKKGRFALAGEASCDTSPSRS
jgi:PleD family two-component response regulator